MELPQSCTKPMIQYVGVNAIDKTTHTHWRYVYFFFTPAHSEDLTEVQRVHPFQQDFIGMQLIRLRLIHRQIFTKHQTLNLQILNVHTRIRGTQCLRNLHCSSAILH